jgi:hypothetical protein
MKRVVILAVLLTVFPVGTYAKQSIWIDGSPAPDNLYLYPYSVVTIGIYSDNTNAYTDFLELTDGGVDWAPPTHGQWVGNMFIYPEAGADSLVEKDPYGLRRQLDARSQGMAHELTFDFTRDAF